MVVMVKKWGNSAAVRIPATLLADAGIAVDQPVEIRQEKGRIVIERSHEKSFAIVNLDVDRGVGLCPALKAL